MNAAGPATTPRLAAPAGAAGPADLPLSVDQIHGRSHLEFLLRQVYGNLNAGRTDVAVTNMCHAVRVALAAENLSDSENVLLRLICRDFGGFA